MNKKTLPHVVVKKSSAGLGLYATKDFVKDELIIEYTGERINADEANRRGGKYLFEVTDNITIDGTKRHNTARYINHACKPNAEAIHDEETNRIFIHAKKRIPVGSEITYDYGKEYFESFIKPHGCRCSRCTSK